MGNRLVGDLRARSAVMRGCWCVTEYHEASAELVILGVLSAGDGGPLMHACRCGPERSAQIAAGSVWRGLAGLWTLMFIDRWLAI